MEMHTRKWHRQNSSIELYSHQTKIKRHCLALSRQYFCVWFAFITEYNVRHEKEIYTKVIISIVVNTEHRPLTAKCMKIEKRQNEQQQKLILKDMKLASDKTPMQYNKINSHSDPREMLRKQKPFTSKQTKRNEMIKHRTLNLVIDK